MVSYYTTIQSILNYTRMFFDILIMWLLLYYTIKIVRNNSRTIQIFKGIVLVLVIKAIANVFGLNTVGWLADMFVSWGFIAIIIIFQPEIRSLLEKLGKSNVFSRITTLSGNEREHLVDELVKAIMILSKDQTGALVTLEQSQSLSDYVKTGTPMNSVVTAELLTSIFVTSTPLHDGAVIIQGDRIACASAYFPPTGQELPSRYGARHRAAIGISEITDSVTIVVSEETGAISIAEGGKITTVSKRELRDYLLRVVCNEETVVREKAPAREGRRSYFVIEEPQLVIEKENEPQKKSDKGLLNKIVVKKQEPARTEETAEEKNTESKTGLFTGIFGKKKEAGRPEDRISQLEKEEEDIKLPKKKKKKSGPSSLFEEPEVLEQQIAEAQKAHEESEQPAREAAAVTEVLEIRTAESKPASTKPRRPRKKAEGEETRPAKTKKKAAEETSKATAAAEEPAAEKQDHSPIDEIQLEFSVPTQEQSESAAVDSVDQEGSDRQ